jgi:broad specificity phosphatase PhoE
MTTQNPQLPQVYLARHGETAWSLSGQHTGLTDIPLTPKGELNARELGNVLKGIPFTKVFTSPLLRAVTTCKLAGFGDVATLDPDLVEWNYGDYEGETSAQIRQEHPNWDIFRDGCPGGESPTQIGARAARVVAKLRPIPGNVLLFSHGHFLRVFITQWLGLEPYDGRYFFLSTAALSIAGYERDLIAPVIRLWNDCHHIKD